MESIPEEIFDIIIMFCEPAAYANFILSYDRALTWFSSATNRDKYKRQFIKKVTKYYKSDPNKIKKSYTLLTVPGYKNWVVKHYTQERYYINGELFSTTTYRRGEKHGKYCEFFRDNKTPKKIIHYYEGKPHGLSEEYYFNGIIFRKGIYINGNKHGEHIENFDSGKPYEQCTYHQGKKLMPMKVQTIDRTKPPCIG